MNSAHPLENPTAWSNLVEMLAILLIPAGLVYMYGKMVGSVRHGWVILGVMTAFLVVGAVVANVAEQSGNPNVGDQGIARDSGGGQPGGNMEGKETRFGIGSSTLWATTTTLASNGSLNSMLDSYTPTGRHAPRLLVVGGRPIIRDEHSTVVVFFPGFCARPGRTGANHAEP